MSIGVSLRPAVVAARAGFGFAARAFEATLDAPEVAQARVMSELSAAIATTDYGRHFGIRSPSDFRARLPVVTWDDLAPWLARQRASEGRVLLPGPARFYEKTSGSSGAAKLVPYTNALLRSFTRMFAIWAHDLIANGPRFRTGQLYFSVSPSFAPAAVTERGVSIGLEDDTDYLGPWLKPLLRPFFIVPPGASHARQPSAWKRIVATQLVRSPRLEVLSVWNPSFIKVLLDWIGDHRDELARALRLDGDSARAEALAQDPIPWTRLWPELKLVSCWASAGAAPLARALEAMLPGVLLQGKGLLATEAPMTVPSIRAQGHLPLVDEVYFEFEEEHGGALRTLDEVDVGGVYNLIISQRAGLLRYRIGDRVKVSHRYRRTPCLEFLGRGAATSDLVGEKLHEDFVRGVLAQLDLGGAFFQSLVPVRSPQDRYVLLLDASSREAATIGHELDAALSQAHHYGHARALGQLAEARVLIVPRAEERVRDYHASRGMRWGDIKHRLLVTTPSDEMVNDLRERAR